MPKPRREKSRISLSLHGKNLRFFPAVEPGGEIAAKAAERNSDPKGNSYVAGIDSSAQSGGCGRRLAALPPRTACAASPALARMGRGDRRAAARGRRHGTSLPRQPDARRHGFDVAFLGLDGDRAAASGLLRLQLLRTAPHGPRRRSRGVRRARDRGHGGPYEPARQPDGGVLPGAACDFRRAAHRAALGHPSGDDRLARAGADASCRPRERPAARPGAFHGRLGQYTRLGAGQHGRAAAPPHRSPGLLRHGQSRRGQISRTRCAIRPPKVCAR